MQYWETTCTMNASCKKPKQFDQLWKAEFSSVRFYAVWSDYFSTRNSTPITVLKADNWNQEFLHGMWITTCFCFLTSIIKLSRKTVNTFSSIFIGDKLLYWITLRILIFISKYTSLWSLWYSFLYMNICLILIKSNEAQHGSSYFVQHQRKCYE